nr:flotillin-like protein 1 [Quercus suber]
MITTQRLGEAQKKEINVKTRVELYKNQKEADLAESKAELATKNARWSQASQLAKVESTKAVALREAELQTKVEKKKVLNQTEKIRVELLSKTAVEYETKGLQHLCLTKDEEVDIPITTMNIIDLMEECALSLFGKLLSDRH